MAKDVKGNTISHLATARKQHEVLKMLLSKPWADVNATNLKGLTVLDALLESPCEHGDFLLGEMIRAVGGRPSVGGDHTMHEVAQPQFISTSSTSYTMINIPTKHSPNINRPVWRRMLTLIFKYPLALIGLGYLFGIQEPNANDYCKTKPDTLLIVATLISTITFQGGLNPPGGFASRDDSLSPGSALKAGQALISKSLFVGADINALLCSLIVILVLISPVTKYKVVIKILMWITWVSFFSMGIAFSDAIFILFPGSKDMFFPAWSVTMYVFIIWLWVLFIVYWLKKGRWLNDKRKVSDAEKDHKGGVLLINQACSQGNDCSSSRFYCIFVVEYIL